MRKVKSQIDAEQIRALVDDRGLLTVIVTPNASANEILLSKEGDVPGLHIRTTATPEDGKANADVIAMLAKALGLAKSNLSIVRGATARRKTIKVILP